MKPIWAALVFGIAVVGTSIAVATVAFKFLESSAEANLQNWKLGGAFAGFAFTALLLTEICMQIYRRLQGNELEDYRKQVQELQAKLVRGATPSPGFVIDVDEKHFLVLARPKEWRPKGGVLYQYVAPGLATGDFLRAPSARKRPDRARDVFSANFNVVHVPQEELKLLYSAEGRSTFDPANPDLEELYGLVLASSVSGLKTLDGYREIGTAPEYLTVDGHKSVKQIHTYSVNDPEGRAVTVRTCTVCTYVPRRAAAYLFTFSDNVEDYLRSSDVFNEVISSIRFL